MAQKESDKDRRNVEKRSVNRKRRSTSKVHRIVIGLAMLLVLMASTSPALSLPHTRSPALLAQAQPQPLQSHAPIQIYSNSDFSSPSSGVRSGRGTPADPYIISGWDINLTLLTRGIGVPVPVPKGGIDIESTNAYFVVRNVSVHDGVTPQGGNQFHGIFLSNVQNGVVRDSKINNDYFGVDMLACSHDTLYNNQLAQNENGISLSGSNYNSLAYNNVSWAPILYINQPNIGYTLAGSSYNTLVYNRESGGIDGFQIYTLSAPATGNYLGYNTALNNGDHGFWVYQGASGNTLVSNKAIELVGNTAEGFSVEQASNEVLIGNYAYDDQLVGFRMELSTGDTLTSNVAIGATGSGTLNPDQVISWGAGIGLFATANITVSSNEVYYNAAGLALSLTNHTRLSDNLSHDNVHGVTLFDSSDFNVFYHNSLYNNGAGTFNDGSAVYIDIINGKISVSDTFSYNRVYHNSVGFILTDAYAGVVEPPTNLTLIGNLIFNNIIPADPYGYTQGQNVGIYADGIIDSKIENNYVFNNPIGLFWGQLLTGSYNNWVVDNVFSNQVNVNDFPQNVGCSISNPCAANAYNVTRTMAPNIIGGSYWGGNYWSDYSGVDLNADRLGDTMVPYQPGVNGIGSFYGGDYLPLTLPVYPGTSPDIGPLILYSSVAVNQGSNGIIPILVWSRNGYSGTATVSVSVSPIVTGGPQVTASPSRFQLAAGGVQAAVINVTNTQTPGTYSLTITFVGSATWTGTIPLTVNPPPSPLQVRQAFTNGIGALLPTDNHGNPVASVWLDQGTVSATTPSQVDVWAQVANLGLTPIVSLKVNSTLPADWTTGSGSVNVFYESPIGGLLNITSQSTITIGSGSPTIVYLSIANVTATLAGMPLVQSGSILLMARLSYKLTGTVVSSTNYPLNYTDTMSISTWTQASFTGTNSPSIAKAFFTAYARLTGDVNGDGKVNIFDLVLVGAAFGSRPGDANWNSAADLNGDGIVNIFDLVIEGSHFGETL